MESAVGGLLARSRFASSKSPPQREFDKRSGLSRWYSSEDRATALAVYTFGNQVSNMAVYPLTASLCQRPWLLGGWPAVFYASGALGQLGF